MARAFIYPGQGSQAVGMGKALHDGEPAARAVFEEVDEALGEKLSDLMFDGDQAALTLTENAQPALMAVSVAATRVLTQKLGRPIEAVADYVAGHSLGEYSALTAAGALTVADAARLLRLRGRAMQQAVPVGIGAMAAILGMELDAVRAVAREAAGAEEVCAAANDNAPGQVVVSGHKAAVERAVALAAERGGRRSVILPVSAPFHCALMQPAAEAMAAALAETAIARPAVPVVTNVAAVAVEDPGRIRQLLVDQVTGAVRWRESVLFMAAQGVNQFIELGAGKVLSGLVRRIERSLEAEAAGTPEDIEALAQRLC
ncbi:MAG: ACP S-malonyltransferase [Azospirillaceae bacterium]